MIREFDITKTCLWVCLFEAEIIQKSIQNLSKFHFYWEDLGRFAEFLAKRLLTPNSRPFL